MKEPLWKRLRELDWAAAEIDDKTSRSVQKLLQDLSSHKEARSMKASQKLWTMLKPPCAYGKMIEPFLYEIRKISSQAVKSEINDLLARIDS